MAAWSAASVPMTYTPTLSCPSSTDGVLMWWYPRLATGSRHARAWRATSGRAKKDRDASNAASIRGRSTAGERTAKYPGSATPRSMASPDAKEGSAMSTTRGGRANKHRTRCNGELNATRALHTPRSIYIAGPPTNVAAVRGRETGLLACARASWAHACVHLNPQLQPKCVCVCACVCVRVCAVRARVERFSVGVVCQSFMLYHV